MPDSARPFDQRKRITGELIELLRVVLASRTLQSLDRSAAQRCWLVFFPFGVEFGHDSQPPKSPRFCKQLQRQVIAATCGPDVRSLRRYAAPRPLARLKQQTKIVIG